MSTAEVLTQTKNDGRAALVGYLPVGFPDVPGSLDAMAELARGGADIIEVGIPYTDPGMDGPVIQRAADAALQAGVRVVDSLHAVEAAANAGAVPVVMSYWNLILQYGIEAYARDLASAGGHGIITPDLLPDDCAAWDAASDAHDLDRIFLAAPSSTPERLALISSRSRGFVYAASTMGVTGTRDQVDSHAEDLVGRVRDAGAEHVCVGLGVSNREQAGEVAVYADGVIVGSALVRALDEGGPAAVGRLAEELREGTVRS